MTGCNVALKKMFNWLQQQKEEKKPVCLFSGEEVKIMRKTSLRPGDQKLEMIIRQMEKLCEEIGSSFLNQAAEAMQVSAVVEKTQIPSQTSSKLNNHNNNPLKKAVSRMNYLTAELSDDEIRAVEPGALINIETPGQVQLRMQQAVDQAVEDEDGIAIEIFIQRTTEHHAEIQSEQGTLKIKEDEMHQMKKDLESAFLIYSTSLQLATKTLDDLIQQKHIRKRLQLSDASDMLDRAMQKKKQKVNTSALSIQGKENEDFDI